MDLRETNQIIHHSKRELSKNVSIIKFEQVFQKLWAFKRNFGFFTTNAHEIWLSHVTPDANFKSL